MDREEETPDVEIMEFRTASENDDPSVYLFSFDTTDDEETIEQEEALEPAIDPNEELRMLADDLNLSLEELRATSGCRRSQRRRKKVDYKALRNQLFGCKPNQPKSLAQLSLKVVNDLDQPLPGPSSASSDLSQSSTIPEDGDVDDCGISELTQFYLTNVLPDVMQSDEEDNEYKPLQASQKGLEIRIGPDYQVDVEDSPLKNRDLYTTAAYVDSNNEHMWSPHKHLSDKQLEGYLLKANSLLEAVVERDRPLPLGHIPDNEEALKILLNSRFNEKMALNRYKISLQNVCRSGEKKSNEFSKNKQKDDTNNNADEKEKDINYYRIDSQNEESDVEREGNAVQQENNCHTKEKYDMGIQEKKEDAVAMECDDSNVHDHENCVQKEHNVREDENKVQKEENCNQKKKNNIKKKRAKECNPVPKKPKQ